MLARLSIGYAVVLGAVLRGLASILTGTGEGLIIAAFDLGLVGRLFPRVRALRPLPQLADHLFGAVVGAVLRRRRETASVSA